MEMGPNHCRIAENRVLLHIHLAQVGCVLEKVVQCGHGKVIIEVDRGEWEALAEGRYEASELSLPSYNPSSPWTEKCATFSGRTRKRLEK